MFSSCAAAPPLRHRRYPSSSCVLYWWISLLPRALLEGRRAAVAVATAEETDEHIETSPPPVLLLPHPLPVAVQLFPADRAEMEELDMDGKKASRSEFSCPYCYKDHDVASLWAHLEEEHRFEPYTVYLSSLCTQ